MARTSAPDDPALCAIAGSTQDIDVKEPGLGRWNKTTQAGTLLLTLSSGVLLFGPRGLSAQSRGTSESAVGQARPTLTFAPLAGRITLDGRLNEAAWGTADSIGELTEVEPRQGATPAARTVVKALASPDEIVIGVVAYQPGGVPVVSYAKAPDSELRSEDHIQIVFDTFLDGRSGYVFAVNPSGARYDALVTTDGDGENKSWDGVWEARTARAAWGWSAEIRIPVRTLVFKEGLHRWGFNVERRIQALQETDRWSGATQDYKVSQTSEAGTLTGVPRLDLGLGLGVRPAFTGGGGKPTPDTTSVRTLHPSVDVTQRLGANLLASLTVNTDFAETEVDTRRTNFTRFPLFFPEKRPFFLEGSDIFAFGFGGHDDVVPFFSRRIGLVEGATVPLRVGTKLSGRVGGTNIGALVAHTGDGDTLSTAGTVGVVRVRQNVLRESSVGFIGTFGDPLERPGSWMIGPDATLRTSHFRGSKNLSLSAWGLVTHRDSLAGDRTAAGVQLSYPNDLIDAALSYVRIGEAFDPSLGFVPRPGVHMASLQVNWQPRPGRVGPLPIRQCFWENEISYVAGLRGGWQSYRWFMAPINCRLDSGDRFEFNIVPQGERLTEPFDVAEGITVPAGVHRFLRFRLEGGLAAKRALSAQLTWWFGGFYDGTLHQVELTSTWNPIPLFTVEVNGEHDIGDFPGGHFTADLWGVRVNANVSPDFQVSSFTQYDTEARALGTNTRMRWTFSPLGALFLVYNHNLADPDLTGTDRWTARRLRFASNQLLIKAQYTVRY
ncbi:MAG: carbohydrate binding family 9 domain-containing protein [Gemmatimonadetes bacterium]|nr:carbohydrate binding family 9 domain-containing protein [Gemmatimonadota bacterium]